MYKCWFGMRVKQRKKVTEIEIYTWNKIPYTTWDFTQFTLCETWNTKCRIDGEGVIKVGDFGLSEYVYEKQYFRQSRSDNLKLPIKWMALESMENAVFTEKSDVVSSAFAKYFQMKITLFCFQWSFGVTCWEIFSGGKQPYQGIPPMSLPRLLHDKHRMDRPLNYACSIEM